MFYETFFPVTNPDFVSLHKFMEARFKAPGVDSERSYLWGYDDTEGCIHVRSPSPIQGMMWRQPTLPETGDEIEFVLRASAKRPVHLVGGKRGKAPVRDFGAWFERKSAEIGVTLLDVDVASEVHDLAASPRPFRLCAAKITGAAVIDDAEVFARSLIRGIGDKKAWGFGYLHYAAY